MEKVNSEIRKIFTSSDKTDELIEVYLKTFKHLKIN